MKDNNKKEEVKKEVKEQGKKSIFTVTPVKRLSDKIAKQGCVN